MEINKFSSVPLYIQISQTILKKIESGYYKKNEVLPSETEIQEIFSVSRITARKSYDILIKQGIIRAVRGKGTYVNDIHERDWTWMNHFTEEVKNQDRIPSSIVIEFKEQSSNEDIASVLQIEIGSPVYYIKRLRCIDNVPVWLTKSYIPTCYAEGFSREYLSQKGISQSLFFVLENDFLIEFGVGEVLENNMKINERDMAILGLTPQSEIIKTGFLGKNKSGVPIVYEKTIFEPHIVKKQNKEHF
ncbi:MAG: GntR family transcriptional regulator [Spirochaetales bacterium]